MLSRIVLTIIRQSKNKKVLAKLNGGIYPVLCITLNYTLYTYTINTVFDTTTLFLYFYTLSPLNSAHFLLLRLDFLRVNYNIFSLLLVNLV